MKIGYSERTRNQVNKMNRAEQKRQTANKPHVNFLNEPLNNNRFYLSTYFHVSATCDFHLQWS